MTPPSTPARRRFSLLLATVWMALGLICVYALSSYKGRAIESFSGESLTVVEDVHEKFRALFHASFYFYFKDQFLPGVAEQVAKVPRLARVVYISTSGTVLFDSVHDPKTARVSSLPSGVADHLQQLTPTVLSENYRVYVLMPSGPFAVLYEFDGGWLGARLAAWFGAGALLWILFLLAASRLSWGWLRPILGLRSKFFAAILLVNLVTAAIVYVTVLELQSRQEKARIRKDSIAFARFSTPRIVADFGQYYYFYFSEKFLPSLKQVIAANQNLAAVKVYEADGQRLLFDSVAGVYLNEPSQETPLKISAEEALLLKTQGFVLREISTVPLLSIVVHESSGQSSPGYWVEYLFGFESLEKGVRAIRQQILLDLIPAFLIGIVVAAIFGQFLISPIRKLVQALKAVQGGDYDVKIASRRFDEIGELIGAFNAMTSELRRKTELRKYISDSTYRRVMAAAEASEGSVKLKGQRVEATVLFCDIRNFVKHCESLPAEEITDLLNDYFSEMVEVIYRNGGEVDKFIGDALLAVFYDAAAESCLKAIHCALEMRESLTQFNAKQAHAARPSLEIGIGIAWGEVISGPIGSKDRMDFTVIGDVVNLASRIEKLSRNGRFTKVVLTEEVEKRVHGLLLVEEMKGAEIRGKEESVRVFELVQIRDISSLLASLASQDQVALVRSVELLGLSQNREAIGPLVGMLREDREEAVRIAAVEALSRLSDVNDPIVLEAFFAALASAQPERLLSALITAVGKICRDGRIVALQRFLDDSNERVVANAIEAIGRANLAEAVDWILPKLGSRNNRVKANAAIALFSAGHIGVIDALKPMLLHSDPFMRSSAAFAMGELATVADQEWLVEKVKSSTRDIKVLLAEVQECVPMLVALLKDSELMVRRQAVVALGKMRDRSAILPILDSLDFEGSSKEFLREAAQALRAIGSHRMVRELLERIV